MGVAAGKGAGRGNNRIPHPYPRHPKTPSWGIHWPLCLRWRRGAWRGAALCQLCPLLWGAGKQEERVPRLPGRMLPACVRFHNNNRDTSQVTFLVINMQKQIESSSPAITRSSHFREKSALQTRSSPAPLSRETGFWEDGRLVIGPQALLCCAKEQQGLLLLTPHRIAGSGSTAPPTPAPTPRTAHSDPRGVASEGVGSSPGDSGVRRGRGLGREPGCARHVPGCLCVPPAWRASLFWCRALAKTNAR